MFKTKKRYIVLVVIVIIFFIAFTVFNYIYKPKDLELIKKYSELNGLESEFVCAVIKTESGFDPNATSNRSASGYMQIIEKTAMWGSEELKIENFSYNDIYDPELNIKIGTWYLKKLVDQFGTYDTALAAYNAGSGNVEKWLKSDEYSDDGVNLKNIPYGETKRYVKKVNRNYNIYKFLFKLKGY